MAKLMETLIPVLFLLAAVATTARSHTTSLTYDFRAKQQPLGLELQGDAHFPSNSTILRLTDALPNQVGRALHLEPLQFWNSYSQVDFETTIEFIITPDADVPPGHGLAFFIAPLESTIPPGSTGANLGIFGSNGYGNGVFAVVFDTVFSAWHRSLPNIGINLGSRISINTTTVGNFIIGQQVKATISYVAATNKISAAIAVSSGETFEVSYVYDLRNLVNQQVQVGLSAATGQLLAKHDIVSWNFKASTAATAKSRKHLGNVIQQFV